MNGFNTIITKEEFDVIKDRLKQAMDENDEHQASIRSLCSIITSAVQFAGGKLQITSQKPELNKIIALQVDEDNNHFLIAIEDEDIDKYKE